LAVWITVAAPAAAKEQRKAAAPASPAGSHAAALAPAVQKLLHAGAEYADDEDELAPTLTAIAALGEPAIPPVAAALNDADENVRLVAVQALQKIGGARVLEPLLSALRDRSKPVRRQAVESLGALRDRRVVQPLLKQFAADPDRHVRYECLTSLGAIGDPAASPALVKSTHDNDPLTRKFAMQALCWMHDPKAPALAAELARDANADVRTDVLVKCEAALDTPQGHQALIDLAISSDDFATSTLARRNLGNYRQSASPAAALTEQMRRAGRAGLTEPAHTVNAALLLGDLRDPAAVDGLCTALQSPNYLLRFVAARQLGQIGDPRAVPALIAALGDSQEAVTAMAYNALQWFAQDGDARAQEAVNNYKGKKFDHPMPR